MLKTYLYTLVSVGALLCSQSLCGAESDGELRTGRLPNGLTYYVRQTAVQPDMAGFYLVQNVGSLMEEDSQQGLAHFLEHMAFNASKNFPMQVDRFLQKNNLTSYNAYTAQDQTVYNIDNVPTNSQHLVDSCLLILHDWCHYLTFAEQGIAKERGIIVEEWRTTRDAVARAREQIVSLLYNGSRYAKREVIGDVSVLETFKRDELVDYYNRWYRPDLQAVVVVGDIDAQRVEQFIIDRFSQIPKPVNPQPRTKYTIDECVQPQYVCVVDKELGAPAMELIQRIAKQPVATTKKELIRRITLRQLYNQMIAGRLSKMINDSESVVYSATVEYDELVRGYDANTIMISSYPQRDYRALTQVLAVVETVKKLGFMPAEFESNRRQMLRHVDGIERNMDRVGHSVFVNIYQNHYLNATPIVEPMERGKLTREVLNELNVADLNKWVASWAVSDANRVFIISGNDPDYNYLKLDDIMFAAEDVRDMELVQPVFTNDTARLIDFPLVEGTVVSQKALPVGNAVQWRFANGATVNFKAADEGSGKFFLSASSKGGLSLIKDVDIPSAQAIKSLAFASGVYNTDRRAMIELMQSRDMEIEFSLQTLGENISGIGPSSLAEQFFEMLYLGLTRPRFDESEFVRYINELKISIETSRPTEMDLVADSVRQLFSKQSPIMLEVDSTYIAQIDLERVKVLFGERFCNTADFTFNIVGDLTLDEAKSLARRYIGSLPASKSNKREKYVLHKTASRTDNIQKEYVVDMPNSRAVVDISLSNSMKMDRTHSTAFWLMGVILNSRCTDEIRERLGGSYDVSVSTRYNELSQPHQWLSMHFETGAERVDQMKRAMYKELDDMIRDGVTQADVESIVSAQKRRLASQPKDAQYWMNALETYADRGVNTTQADYHSSVLDQMSPELVHRVAKEFSRKARRIEIVMRSRVGGNNDKIENDKLK